MKLSRTLLYALRASLRIAEANSDAPVPCSRLAAEGEMPERFLLQILRTLVTSGILTSTRGVEGGYRLADPPEKITLLSLVEAIEPFDKLPSLSDFSDRARQVLSTALANADESLKAHLRAVTLADLITLDDPTSSSTSSSSAVSTQPDQEPSNADGDS